MGPVADQATKKSAKYDDFTAVYIFEPTAVENLGPINASRVSAVPSAFFHLEVYCIVLQVTGGRCRFSGAGCYPCVFFSRHTRACALTRPGVTDWLLSRPRYWSMARSDGRMQWLGGGWSAPAELWCLDGVFSTDPNVGRSAAAAAAATTATADVHAAKLMHRMRVMAFSRRWWAVEKTCPSFASTLQLHSARFVVQRRP